MTTLKVAMIQAQSAGTDPQANLVRGIELCRYSKAQGADVALFPEMWSTGYAPCPEDDVSRRAWRDTAVDHDSEYVQAFQRIGAELELAVVATYLSRDGDSVANSATLIDSTGTTVFTYDKVHTCDFDFEAECKSGREFRVGELRTAAGSVQVGLMICFDREYPESARVLMLKGAELILVPNGCPLEVSRLSQLRTRAFENMVGIATANYPGQRCQGSSAAFDAIVFDGDERPVDPTLAIAGFDECILMATFDLDRLRRYRATEVWGASYRKPVAYQALVENVVPDVFFREPRIR